VLVAAGHGANGLLLGPVTGRLVADVIGGRPPALDLAPFSPARFAGLG
jgi:glycine/D-amino acid oxidase-like deaminating enzyme